MKWNLADVFEVVAEAVPQREALVHGARRATFSETDDRANRLAHVLAASGVGTGDRVALDLYNAPEYLEATFAAFKLRAVPVNVNWRYTAGELAYVLEDAGAAAVVVHRSLAGPLLDALPKLSRRPTLVAVDDGGDLPPQAVDYVDYEAALAEAPAARDFPARSPDDLYILYTGGTTGPPKGVMWRHEDVMRAGLFRPDTIHPLEPRAVAERAKVSRRRALPVTPLMHGTGQWTALSTLLGGGTVVLSPDRRLDPVRLWELVAAERVDFLALVGDGVARPLVDTLDERGDLDLSCVRMVVSSGAILSPAVKDALSRHLPGLMIVDTYGSSETGPEARETRTGTGGHREGGRFAADDPRTVVLGDDLRPVAAGSGAVGRLARGGHVALGYWGDPEKTAATFPVVDGVRYAVTGDHARVEADGTITLLGRGAACINTGGEKVYPEEVEAVLKAHPDVFDALVVGLPDERFGERVVAVVQPRAGRRPQAASLEAHARRSLAGYKIPRAVVFADALRRSPAGKPDYPWAREEALRQLS